MDKEATRVETTKLCQRIGELEELLNANASIPSSSCCKAWTPAARTARCGACWNL
jgi:hypothetical protein